MRNNIKKIFNYIFKDNPLFVYAIGICPVLAVTTTFEKSYIMGLIVFVILTITHLLVSLIKKVVNGKIRVYVYIILISILVTGIEFLLSRYIKPLYDALGIYVPLLVIDSIILESAVSYTSNNTSRSIKDALKNGTGFLFFISLIGFIRELLGTGTLTFMNYISNVTGYRSIITVFNNNIIPNKLFITAGGAFILVGILLGIINSLNKRGEN